MFSQVVFLRSISRLFATNRVERKFSFRGSRRYRNAGKPVQEDDLAFAGNNLMEKQAELKQQRGR